MRRFLLIMLIFSSFCRELYSLPLQEESFHSGCMHPKNSQERRICDQTRSNIESTITYNSKFPHVIIHRSSSGSRGSRSSSSGSSSKSGSSGSTSTSSRPTSSGGKTRSSSGSTQTNSGGNTRSTSGFRTPPTSTTPFNPVYVNGNTNNGHHYINGADNCNRIGLSTLIAAAIASFLHAYVAFGHS